MTIEPDLTELDRAGPPAAREPDHSLLRKAGNHGEQKIGPEIRCEHQEQRPGTDGSGSNLQHNHF
jgi:hypothetical protein